MAEKKLVFQLQQPPFPLDVTIYDNGTSGPNWQYVGASAVELESRETVTLTAMKRDNSSGALSFSASMLTATILFKVQDNDVADHITIQGVHDLANKTNNETGSVSSASRRFSHYIGGLFSFDAAKLLLTVSARTW